MKKKGHKNPTQVSVNEASSLLGISSRSVLNYIKSREIEAIKVGKQWYVELASVEVFKQRYGFNDNPQTEAEKEVETADKQVKAVNKCQKLASLRCYNICKTAFQMPKWNPVKVNNDRLQDRLVCLRNTALESLGAGFYSFHSATKAKHYEQSRNAVGAILAQLQAGSDEFLGSWSEEIYYLENELLPAYSSLIKKIEKRKRP